MSADQVTIVLIILTLIIMIILITTVCPPTTSNVTAVYSPRDERKNLPPQFSVVPLSFLTV